MKKYSVSVDFTMSKTIEIFADDADSAIAKTNEVINKNPYDFAYGFSHYVGHEVIDANEEE